MMFGDLRLIREYCGQSVIVRRATFWSASVSFQSDFDSIVGPTPALRTLILTIRVYIYIYLEYRTFDFAGNWTSLV